MVQVLLSDMDRRGVARLTLNRPERRNALDGELLAALLARIAGPAYGGGIGLIACCDTAIAAETASFALSEARLGLAPAVIAPYVIAAIGARQTRRLFLIGARIDAREALRLGLVHRVVTAEALDVAVEAEIADVLAGGPQALTHCKRVSTKTLPEEPERAESAERLARLWTSDEAREGLSAFLEKRKPRWDEER